jgi:aspartate dehydrogenase
MVEAAPAAVFPEIARATLTAGRSLVVLTVGALLDELDAYAALARKHGATLHIASGAIGGLDALTAAAQGQIDEVVMTTRKPPRGLAGAPYLVERGIDLSDLTEPRVVFQGTAREACRGFPANVNVAAAVSLAGIGPDRTQVRIIADPTLERNTHEVRVSGEFGRFTLQIENRPTENPRTGILTALSVIATLRRMAASVRLGT